MRLLFLCKRRPQNKDLLTRPNGRFYYLPHLLSEKGHEVYILLLSYQFEPSGIIRKNNITWQTETVMGFNPISYISQAKRVVRSIDPHWIVGFSDTYFGILAQRLAARFGTRSAIDAYDNYESYIPWLKPLHQLWRSAINKADIVTAAGPQLAQYLNRFRPHKNVHVVPMAADPSGFLPLDKHECRTKLNLPQDKKLIGYCGSIHQNRGIKTVFNAYERIRNANPNSLLVLSGLIQKKIRLPANTIYLGYLSDDDIPILLNCMDVLIVPNILSAFGKYSYPVKLYEAISCGIPVVAADTEPMRWILDNRSRHLAKIGDPDDMAIKVGRLLDLGNIDYGLVNTWENSNQILETALLEHEGP
jgi:glycosyltransferase involved in cell wall biosynthesis